MSKKPQTKKLGSSTSMPDAKLKTKKTLKTQEMLELSSIPSCDVSVVSPSLTSPLGELYKLKEFRDESTNDLKLHLAENFLNLRRARALSQKEAAKLMGTSQSAIARIESAQDNLTVDTVERLAHTLGGRIYVTVYPAEMYFQDPGPWWESNSWQVAFSVTNRTPTHEQAVVGLERLIQSDSTNYLSMTLISTGASEK